MALLSESDVLDILSRVARAAKAFDGRPTWRRQPGRGTEVWMLTVALRLDDLLAGGASVRLKTPTQVWEEDVYGHVEVRVIGIPRAFRLDPIEWRPLAPHTNPPDAPDDLGSMVLFDRHHPAALNLLLGMSVLQQTAPGVAVPLPRDITTFREYVNLCAEAWNFPDMRTIEPPEWKPTLL
jgi:hypothetical protein